MDVPAPLPSLPDQPESAAELIVARGRLAGARWALTGPLTLLGQGTGCDLRLPEDGVALLHCAVIRDDHGPLLRDLGSPTGTRVNGQSVTTHRLTNGDRIEIGEAIVEVALDTPPTAEHPTVEALLTEQERESLRIQAAAVVAQQAALDDVEVKLDQHRVALERQETQLSRHLDERNQELDRAEKSLEQDRVLLRSEREAVARDREKLTTDQQEHVRQRERLQELQRGLVQRYEKMSQACEVAAAARESEAAAMVERAKKERAIVQAFQERLNGELELGRQQLRDQRRTLEEAKAAHEANVRSQVEAIQRRDAELRHQAEMTTDAAALLAAEQDAWQVRKADLTREVTGLEARVKHLREQLEILSRDKARATTTTPAPALREPIIPPPMSPALLPPPGAPSSEIKNLHDMLGDQREHLLDQWRQLLGVQQAWQEERQTAMAALEQAAEDLRSREQELSLRQQQQEQDQALMVQRQQQVTVLRSSLDGWRSRLAAEEANWKADQQHALDDLSSRESLLQTRQQQLEQVHQLRNVRRKQEVAETLGLRARCEEARREYIARWKEYERLRANVEQQQRDLAAQSQAIDQARDELIHSAPDSARVANQLEKLQKRHRARLDLEVRALEADRRRLQQDMARTETDTQLVKKREEELLARQLDLTRRIEEWESQRALGEEEEARRQIELRRLRARHAVDERQLRQYREELERLARLLIEDADDQPAQAA